MDLGIRDKVFLVTGGNRRPAVGSGPHSRAGGGLVISSRRQEAVDKAIAELGGTGAALGVAADNADPAAADRLIRAAQERFGHLDGLLISVGAPATGPHPG